MRKGPILASLLVFVLSIISTVNTLLAATSKSWSTQSYFFDPDAGPNSLPSGFGPNESMAACVAERSPFYRCGLPRIDANGTCEIPYCSFYPAYGYNQTSCRSVTEFGGDLDYNSDDTTAMGLLGRSMECQEVHYAGNLQIAASVFLTLGLVLTLVLSSMTIIIGFMLTAAEPAKHHQAHHREDPQEGKLAEAEVQERERPRRNRWVRSTATPYVVAVLLSCLYIGSLMQILAQYFGVLGLTVNATPTAIDAHGTQKNATLAYYTADSWEIGPGLSTYATIAWASALVCAGVATTVFRTPRFPKLL